MPSTSCRAKRGDGADVGDAAALRPLSLRSQRLCVRRLRALFPPTKKDGTGRVTSTRAVSTRPERWRPADLAAERLDEEENQRDREHVDDERLDEHETQDQRAADVARRARVPRDRLDR